MTIIETIKTTKPYEAAIHFSTLLAVDKGVPSEVKQTKNNYLVITDDGRAILFRQIKTKN